jgi:hypothetical protein
MRHQCWSLVIVSTERGRQVGDEVLHHGLPRRAALVSPTTPSPVTLPPTRPTPGLLHGALLQQYDCTEQAAPQPPPPSAGSNAAANAGAHPQPPAGSQNNNNGILLLRQLDRLHLAFKRRQVSTSASSSYQDQQDQQPTTSIIPTQKRVTEHLTKHWASFKALRQRYAGTRFEEQRQLTCHRNTKPRPRTPPCAWR